MTDRLLSPHDVAEYTQLSYRTVLRAIEDGELPASRLRGRLRISRSDMLAWVDKAKTKKLTNHSLRRLHSVN